MKKFKVVIKGELAKEIRHEIMGSIYDILKKYGYMDVEVKVGEKEKEKEKTLQVPEFMNAGHREALE